MTTPTFIEDLRSGGGTYAAIYHIAGMPWACTTHGLFARQLNGEGSMAALDIRAVRDNLFGNVVATTYHPSSYVQLIPSLDADLGGQSVKYDESKGLECGGWKVTLGREAGGAEYSDTRDHATAGIYDGLDIIPSPDFDPNIATGRLSSNYIPPTTTLKWIDDHGLAAYITAQVASKGFAVLWCGSSCFVTTDGTPTLSSGEYTITGTSSRVFRTPREPVYTATDDSPSKLITNAPTLGIVGSNAIVWLMRVDPDTGIPTDCDAGTGDVDDYQTPIILREGPVAPGPVGNPGEWTISHHDHTKWWDAKIPFDRAEGKLTGYRFTRQPASFDAPNGDSVVDSGSELNLRCQTPHLYLLEWDTVSGGYERTNLWLCNAASSVTFETLQDVVDAVQDEIDNQTHSPAAPYQDYSADLDGLTINDPTASYPTFVTGAVAWILGYGRPCGLPAGAWGDIAWAPPWEVATHTTMALDMSIYDGNNMAGGWRQIMEDENPTPRGTFSSIVFPYLDELVGAKMKYYYEYNFTTKDFCNVGWFDAIERYTTGAHSTLTNAACSSGRALWPIPYDSINTDYRLNMSPEVDATFFVDDEPFTIGPQHKQLNSVVDSTGANYIKTPTTTAYIYDSIPCLYIENDVTLTKLRWPTCLFELDFSSVSVDYQQPQDVVQSTVANGGTLETVFRGLLGDDTDGASMPSRSRLWYVPDVYDDSGDMRELVDWDRLAYLTDGLYPNSKITLPTTGEHNVWKAFMSALKTHGVRPTRGYNDTVKAFNYMSFEIAGIVSASDAFLAGREITDDLLMPSDPKVKHGGSWLYRDIEAKVSYVDDDPGLTLKCENQTSKASISSAEKTLKIEDKFLQLDPTDELSFVAVMDSMISRLNITPTIVSAPLTPAGLVIPTVGSSALLSADLPWDIYAGSRGMSQRGALVVASNIKWGANSNNKTQGKLSIDCTVRVSPHTTTGWAPSLPLTGAMQSLASTTVTLTGVPTTAATSSYTDPNGGLTDLATFGCFKYSAANGLEARDCSCTAFTVRVVDRDTTTWTTSGASRNVWTGTIAGSVTDELTLADIAAGTARLLLDDATNYDDTTAKVVLFRERDFVDLQSCQTVYGVLGDASGFAEDSAGTKQRAMAWV